MRGGVFLAVAVLCGCTAREPIPNGHGRVEIDLRAVPSAADVGWSLHLVRPGAIPGSYDFFASAHVDDDGGCRFDVPPGEYQVELGDAAHPVRVSAGEVRRVVLRRAHFGSIRVDGAPGFMEVVASGGGEPGIELLADRRGRFVPMPPGTYEVLGLIGENGDDARRIGLVDVVAGEQTRVRVDVPTAELTVTVEALEAAFDSKGLRLALEPDDRNSAFDGFSVWLPTPELRDGTATWVKRFIAIEPGRYRLVAHLRSRLAAEERITVTSGATRYRLDLRSK